MSSSANLNNNQSVNDASLSVSNTCSSLDRVMVNLGGHSTVTNTVALTTSHGFPNNVTNNRQTIGQDDQRPHVATSSDQQYSTPTLGTNTVQVLLTIREETRVMLTFAPC